MSVVCADRNACAPLPWRRGVLWLLVLGPFFFLSYGYANQSAAARAVHAAIFFEWERGIPFLPWTIVPYWSIDLLYGFSFLCCRDARAVDRHGLRLLSAQCISVACFLAFPLRFAFERPASDGWFGAMFDALTSFDQPYNQAPSLHIGLLVLIWVQFARLPLSAPWRFVVHAWAALIGVSVLTTWQHHLIDVPTGAAVGLLCLWWWPDAAHTPPWRRDRTGDANARARLARWYALGAVASLAFAGWIGGLAWCLVWPACALAMVAWSYAWCGAAGFQKTQGRHTLAVRWLMAPYLLAAWINSRAWTRRNPQDAHIVDGVWLGRMPSAAQMRAGGYAGLVDLAAEMGAPTGPWRVSSLPWLDLVVPSAAQLAAAARAIDAAHRAGAPVLVACALGYSRSACAVVAWLRSSGRAATIGEAVAMVRAARPQVVLGPAWIAALEAAEPELTEARNG